MCRGHCALAQADIAIIPAIEYQRIDDLVILPDMAIASKKQVRSLLIVSKKPIEEVKSLALDRSSRSTQALTRILCAEKWKSHRGFLKLAPIWRKCSTKSDAALLIGDLLSGFLWGSKKTVNWRGGQTLCRRPRSASRVRKCFTFMMW